VLKTKALRSMENNQTPMEFRYSSEKQYYNNPRPIALINNYRTPSVFDYCRRNDEEKNTSPTALIPHRDKVPWTGTKIHSSRATGHALKETFGTFHRHGWFGAFFMAGVAAILYQVFLLLQ